jgi:hypothetical protein
MKKKLFFMALAFATLFACKKQDILQQQDTQTVNTSATKNGLQTFSATQTSVFNVTETIAAATDRDRLRNNWLLTDFTATGIYMAPNATLNITVQQTTGSTLPKLLIGTYSRYGAWSTQPTSVQLTAGTNTVTNAAGGLLWIRYTTTGTPSSTAKITFNSGYQYAPYYKVGVTNNVDWQNQLQTYTTPDVVMEGSNCFVVVARDKAIQYQTEDQTAALNKITQIIGLEDDLNGLDGSNALHTKSIYKYLLTQHEDPAYYFFAYDYRTAYISNDVEYILQPSLLGGNGWGVWHELGHQHQQKWQWGGIGEVSVNIYSLYVQRILTGQNRLVTGNTWPKAFAYLSKPVGTKDYNGSTSYANPLTDVFARLCMFEQLTLAYGDTFWKNIAKKTREDAPVFANDDAKLRYFMLSACNRSGKNLSNFFKQWGLNLSTVTATNQIYTDMVALGLPTPTIDPATLQDNTTEMSKTGWSINSFSSEETSGEGAVNGRASTLIDGNATTFWHSRWSTSPTSYPHYFVIDLGTSKTSKGLGLTQRSNLVRAIKDFQVLTSTDGVSFTAVNNYVAQNVATNQYFDFGSPKTFRYLKLIANSAHDGLQFASLAEVKLYQ